MRIFPRQIAVRIVSISPLLVLAAVGILFGQNAAPVPTPAASPLPQFEDVTQKSGIDFRHSFGEKDLSSILEGAGSGCAWIDYNNDGLLDLYVVNGRYMSTGITDHSAPDGKDATNHLYRNNGDGTFTDVTPQAGVAGKGFGVGVTAGDFDNDGNEDLYVTNYNSAILYHNNGNGTFTDVTAKAGVDKSVLRNGSGLYRLRPRWPAGSFRRQLSELRSEVSAVLHRAALSRARSDMRRRRIACSITTATARSPMSRRPRASQASRGAPWASPSGDYDNDGWPDIYVANDTMASFLYHNNHNGTFTDVAADLYAAYGQNGEASTAMGPDLRRLRQRWMAGLVRLRRALSPLLSQLR